MNRHDVSRRELLRGLGASALACLAWRDARAAHYLSGPFFDAAKKPEVLAQAREKFDSMRYVREVLRPIYD